MRDYTISITVELLQEHLCAPFFAAKFHGYEVLSMLHMSLAEFAMQDPNPQKPDYTVLRHTIIGLFDMGCSHNIVLGTGGDEACSKGTPLCSGPPCHLPRTPSGPRHAALSSQGRRRRSGTARWPAAMCGMALSNMLRVTCSRHGPC